MAIYSHSRLSTFEKCPLKFKFKYIDFTKADFEETIEGFLGKEVHKALELIYSDNKKTIELDEVIKYFVESWNKNFNNKIKLTKSLLPEYFFNKGIKFIINYFNKNFPFKDNTIATEKKIFINLDKEGKYKLTGYIDRLVHNPGNIFEIHDYKTGAIKSNRELDNDRQLALYSLSIKESFENVNEIYLIWHFLDENKDVRIKTNQEALEKLKDDIKKLIDKIESTIEFPGKPGKLCEWCEFQSKCPSFKEYNEKNKYSKNWFN